MAEKIEMDLLHHLNRHQNRLTFELTEWLIEQFYEFPDDPKNNQAALLQGWVRLLIQSLLVSVKSAEPKRLTDFVVVLREEGQEFFEDKIWRAALDWLSTRCHHFLKIKALSYHTLSVPSSDLVEIGGGFCCHYETLATLLSQLDVAFRAGISELDSHRLPSSLLQSGNLSNIQPASRFSLN